MTMKFSSPSATIVLNGDVFTGNVVFDGPSNAQQITYLFAGSKTCVESEFYLDSSRYQICDASTCNGYYITLNTPAYDLKYPNGSNIPAGTAESISGIGNCVPYSYSQDGTNVKIWVLSTNSTRICKVSQTSSSFSRVITFTTFNSYTGTISKPSNSQYPGCSSSVQCGSAMDLVLVIDQSGSINATEFAQEMAYVKQVVNSFVFGEQVGAKMGYVLFSSQPNVTLQLTSNQNTLLNAIDNTVQQDGETNIGDAIAAAHNLFASGGRSNAPNIIFLLTDGNANLPESSVTGVTPGEYAFNKATFVKSQGDLIFGVAVGSDVTANLATYTSGPDYIASVTDFSKLQETLNKILQTICTSDFDSCVTSSLNCNNVEFCGCGDCICTIDATSCGDRGTFNSNDCSCSCKGNWKNQNGDLTCSTCGITNSYCSGHGTVDPDTCACTCDANWGGPKCDTCTKTCPTNADVNMCSTCVCKGYWTGANCDVCNTAACNPPKGSITNPTTCNSCSCTNSWTPASNCANCGWSCSGHGTSNSTCNGCNCNTNWSGPNCATCTLTDASCNNHGSPKTSCDSCNCDDGFGGSYCGSCSTSYCKNGASQSAYPNCGDCSCKNSWQGDRCDSCPIVCKNGGTKNAACSGCDCSPPWGGPTCEECQLDCGPHGSVKDATCSSCECDAGWQDSQTGFCNVCVPDLCNYRGTANTATCSSCTCYNTSMATGTFCQNCDTSKCHNYGYPNTACSSCICNHGYSGNQCDSCSAANFAVVSVPCLSGGLTDNSKDAVSNCYPIIYSNQVIGDLCFSTLGDILFMTPYFYQTLSESITITNAKFVSTSDPAVSSNWALNNYATLNTALSNAGNLANNNNVAKSTDGEPKEGPTYKLIASGFNADLAVGVRFRISTYGNNNLFVFTNKDSGSRVIPLDVNTCSDCICNYNCNGHGTPNYLDCTKGCNCFDSWTGLGCNTCDTSKRTPCNNHGNITYDSSDDSCNKCTCDQYWEGDDCSTCNFPCQNSGTPKTPSCSSCNCPSPWNGTDCSFCDFDDLCNGHGTNQDANCNSCDCENNWDPATKCKTCKLDCNGRGTPDKDCNVCECSSPIYTGATCNECVESVLCNGKGTINETASFCSDCNCTEPTVWGGNRCTQCLFECNSPNGTPVETCDACDCHGAWGEADCSVCDTSANSEYCNGKGTVTNDACDVCTCTERWSGDTCNQCTFSCNGHGTRNPECTACVCTAGTEFTVESDCKVCAMECFNGGEPNDACTSCDCVDGWGGKYCDTCVTLPSECVHENTTASPVVIIDTCVCVCADAWVGRLCDECPPPSGGCNYPNGFVISAGGECFCSCNNHFSGVDCSECVFECESTRVMEISDCSCHCPKYFKDDETCETCILTPEDCVHPADPVTVDMDTCNCQCLGGWGDRDCSVCELDPNAAPIGWEFNETSCEYYILCGNGIVNNPPEECEDSDAEGNLVEYPECCEKCLFNTVPCDDNNPCTMNDKCYLGTCVGFSEFDWTLDPSRASIPSGTPIASELFAEWGLYLITLSESDKLVFVDTNAPNGRDNLALPSDNEFGGDNTFPRVVALQTPNDGDICIYANPSLNLGAITVVGAYEQNIFVSTFCGNGSEFNRPVSTYATSNSASVEFIELQCGESGVSRVCIMNAKHAALGPIFMACEDVQPSETSTIGDYVWYDYNMNGIQDEDSNSGVSGVSVTLLNQNGQVLRTTTTNQNGYYLFTNLYAGYYTVRFVVPASLHFTTPLNLGSNYWIGSTDKFALGSNQTDLTRDAGVIYLGAIGDYVWYDLDENGIQDGNLVGVAGVTMNLYYSNDTATVIKTTKTNNDGYYYFTDLPVEQSKGVYYNYIVELVPPALSSVTKPFQGSSILSDSNFNPIAPHLSNVVTLTPSSLVDNSIDGGIYFCCGSIGDKVWYDTDKDGLQNGEAGTPGVNVFLSWNGVVIDSTTTSSDGSYLFTGLSLSGEYRVFFERPSSRYIFTKEGANNGNSPATDSNPDKNGFTDLIVLTVQKPDDLTIDAGLIDGCTTASDCASEANPCQTATCVANVCQFTPKTVCPASTEPCANNVCNPITGTCSLVPKNITCSDNNPCTSNDKCTISGCAGEPNDSLTCSDGNSCTDDECFGGLCVSSPKDCSTSVGTVGQCQTPICGSTGCTIVNVTDNTPCNDGLKCTTDDVCRNGVCSGTPVTCGKGDQCSTISCNTNTGECETTYNTNSNCNDNNACTEGDKCTATGFCAGTPKNCSGTSVPQCYAPVCSGGICVPVFQEIPCSDGNPCTVDSCNPKSKLCESIATNCTNPGPCKRSYCSATTGKCVVENDDSLTCSDNDPCTTDRCSAGSCVSTEKTCTTTNPCKFSYCVDGSCVEQNNAEPCNDNNACTTNDVCTNGACYGTPIVCEDNNTCTSNACVNGTCVYTPLSGVTCDDKSKCTKNSVCINGECKGYDPVVCDDGNVCTTEVCNEETGQCDYTQNAANCTLTDKCLKDGICHFGQCVGVPVSCDLPHNQCVLSVCLNNQCQYQPDPSKQNSPCDDGLVCTENDTCGNGICSGTPVICEKLDVCYDYHCDPVNGCVATPNTNKCDDSNACTYNDVCSNGVCAGTPVNCEDGDVCTNNYCESGICKFNYTTESCSDNNACTTGDTCASGLCVGIPVVCGDGNICTDEVCNPLTGNCDTSFHNGISCTDQNPCTSGDVCLNGACVGNPTVCSGSNICMAYSCNAVNGSCEEKPVSTRRSCDDNNRCTIVDICVEGTCTGKPVVCPAPTHSCESWSCDGNTGVCVRQLLSGNTCSDGNSCTSGDVCVQGVCQGTQIPGCGNNCEATCTPLNPCFTAECVSNECVQTPKSCQANTTCVEYACNIASGQCETRYPSNLCNDNNLCTQFDICVEGVCVGSNEKTCTATAECTTQQCNPSTGNCDVQTVNDGTSTCDDTDKCTINDVCTESGECSGTPLNCNDNNPCTDDLCSNGVCVHINNNDKCEDGNTCTQNDTCVSGTCVSGPLLDCSDGSVCTQDFCKDGECIHEAIPGTRSCNDNSLCTENDLCFGVVCEGTPLNCDDNNECTIDSCSNGVCIHENLVDGSSCDDSDICTTDDQCISGECTGAPKCAGDSVCQTSECNAANGECFISYHDGTSCETEPGLCTADTTEGTCRQGDCVLPPRDCDDNNECTDEYCDEASGCVYLDSYATCTPENGDLCSAYACVLGECQLVVENDCSDNNPCTVDSCGPDGECVHTNVAGGSCSDNDECTINDVCLSDGSCKGVPRSCNDGNICTADSCVSITTAPFWGCTHDPANDDLECQFDRCTNGTCLSGTCRGTTSIVDCPAKACQTVSCSSTSGQCVYENSDDSSLCPAENCKVASCTEGGCVYNNHNCSAQNALNTNKCTRFVCQGNNQCVEIALDDGTSCGDSNSCTSAVCKSGSCKVQTTDCSDEDLCTYDERCDLENGCLATPYSCFLSPCIYYSCNDQGSCNVNSQINTFSEKIYVVFNDEKHSQLLAYSISDLSKPDYVIDYPESNYIYSLAIQPHSGVVYANVNRTSVSTIPRDSTTENLQNNFNSAKLGLDESADDISLRAEFVSSSRAYDYDIYVTDASLTKGERHGTIYNENQVRQGAYSYPFNDKYLAWEPHGDFYLRFVVTAGTTVFSVTSVYPDDGIITLCTGEVHSLWEMDKTTVIGLDISYSGLLFVGTVYPTRLFVVSVDPERQSCAMNALELGELPVALTFATFAVDDTVCPGDVVVPPPVVPPPPVNPPPPGPVNPNPPPPVNPPPPGPVAHVNNGNGGLSGGSGGGSVGPGEDSNIVLTGATGNATTGVVGGVSVALIGACMIFGAILALNSTKEKQPDNLVGVLATEEVSGVAMENPTYAPGVGAFTNNLNAAG